ncbi:MAG TPA: energy transducer TonB [Polyangia bacterium]|nr:energy transducer TonB [Polyangia bacterium]
MRVTSQRRSGAAGDSRGDTHIGGRRHGRKIGFWLAVAALLHAEIILIVGVGLYLYAPRSAELARTLSGGGEGSSIDVGMIDEDAAREIVADLEKQEEERKAEETRKEEESVHPPGQVVDLPAPREEHRPDSAKFVSEHDSTVTHETKKYGHFQDNARQGDESGTAATSQPQAPKGDGRLAMRTPDLGRFLRGAQSASGLPARVGRSGAAYGAPDPGRPEEGGVFSGQGADGRPRAGGGAHGGQGLALLPTDQQMARAVGPGTQDALNNVDDGEETALNSKKWRFASFFNRVKRQVAEHWHPEESYRERDPTGMIYGRKNRYTELRIQLKPDGRLGNVAVYQPSGLDFLDDEAVEAFKEAAPFPNPPRQLIEANGLINFGFGFLFDLNGPPEMRWFKY